jgi:hypothetical protein
MEPAPSAGGLLASPPELSPTEQEVLDEYERLAENMKKVCICIHIVFLLTAPRRISSRLPESYV